MNILNNRGPKIDPSGTPNNISLHKLYLSFIYTLFFLFGRYLWVNFKELSSKPYAIAYAIAHETGNQNLLIGQ